MTTLRVWLPSALLLAALVSGCSCGNDAVITGDGGTADGGPIDGLPDGGGDPDDGGVDAGKPIVVNPLDPQNPYKDSDCDGLSDAEEFAMTYAGGLKTDPAKADSDGDGILDGVELGRTTSVDTACGFVGDADPTTTTSPVAADSDGDGLPDGIEDRNRNGAFEAGETNPLNPDSDGDGIPDGEEDADHDGVVDPGETSPLLKDSDGDGINDGVEKNVTRTNPTQADTDGDTCLDGQEDTNQNGVVEPGETDPNDSTDCGPGNVPDSDGDGLPDAVEDSNGNGIYDPPNETDLHNADTDGDGLPDGLEDKNKNGIVNAGETDPRRKDTDCDGLIDGPTKGAVKGEDQNANGVKDSGETDPTNFDTDGDGIPDGVEVGLTQNPDPTNCPAVKLDADPSTTTSPVSADTDGDGIADGAEDVNQNGRHDSGELDPNSAADGTGPAGKVCTAQSLRPVLFREDGQPDVQLGLPSTFTELGNVVIGGTVRGMMGYDPTSKVAFLVYRTTPSGSTVIDAANAVVPKLNGVATLSNPNIQTFTTWDGFNAAEGKYDQAGSADVKTRANDLANALIGPGAGVLSGVAGANGPFKLQVEYVRRSSQSLVVLLALVPTASFTEPSIFTVSDVAGGSALAQFGDASAVQCELFDPGESEVDFLFVVDDSCSMDTYQAALATSGTAMEANLNNSALDWRVGMVTTAYSYTSGTNSGVFRGFTDKIGTFKAWLNQNSCSGGFCTGTSNTVACTSQNQCWVGINGSATERALHSARAATQFITSTTDPNLKLRPNATLVVIVLADADDQSSETLQTYEDYFNATGTNVGVNKNPLGKKIVVHGIICPDGQNCGETQQNPRKVAGVIAATGGVRGDINTSSSIQTTIDNIVQSAIAAAGYKTKKPPIGASVKVAVDLVSGAACNANDIPRSRVHGFDVDGKAGTVSFFGDCRPAQTAQQAAVSYRYWIDTTPNANGNPPPCSSDPSYDPADPDGCAGNLVCNKVTNQCECPPDCGGTAPPGMICNTNKNVCDFICTPDCGGACSGFETCNQNSCSCDCAQTATCAPGFTFQSGNGVCGCVCDTAALGCGPTFEADPNACACVCKADCGGCPAGQTCNPTICACLGGIN